MKIGQQMLKFQQQQKLHKWMNQFSIYFDTRFRKNLPYTNWDWNGQTMKGYTFSGDSGMESSVLRHILFGLFSYMR